jgi:hypothetical protein
MTAAASWIEITAGLPGNFGYAIAVDPRDPDTVFQVPESDSHMRTVVDGRLRVYRSRDAGAQLGVNQRRPAAIARLGNGAARSHGHGRR